MSQLPSISLGTLEALRILCSGLHLQFGETISALNYMPSVTQIGLVVQSAGSQRLVLLSTLGCFNSALLKDSGYCCSELSRSRVVCTHISCK
eukprot:4728372-Amphidinium_carterae.1